MINYTEEEERSYLNDIIEMLNKSIEQIDLNVQKFANELKEQKQYLYENKAGMDNAEKVSVRQSIYQGALTGESAVAKKNRIGKLMQSPYFGRIDFIEKSEKNVMPVYIGVYSYFDEEQKANIIHDWRAPVSSMFYDYELGEASYEAPSGNILGEITVKRQYRIRKGNMEFMLENSVNVHDDILQKELSKSSDDKMKNIVATIQRDQNAIIRNENSRTLIIQGVAGSGKTSIALHRIAFLLYRYKESISSKEILIISPNKVFADYISNVLPELGEEKIPEMGIEELAMQTLESKFKFQTFFDQVSILLEKTDESYVERIKFKSSFEFLSKLNQYLAYIENKYFQAIDLKVRMYVVPAWFIEERFKAYHRLPLLKRFPEIIKDIEENINIYYKYQIEAKERTEIRKAITGMFKTCNIRELYKDFYQWLEKPELFKLASRSTLEYSDVFPLIYLKIRLEGSKSYDKVKHLLVDEMQDYTPVQYAVLSKLFVCKKTILGDSNQSVNPYSSSSSESINKVFPEADCVKLRKSYRSTIEITNFAQRISRNDDLIAIERHGEEPLVRGFENNEDELYEIKKLINGFLKSDSKSLGIICKTQQQAELLREQLKDIPASIHLITYYSSSFSDGIIITTAHLAKGLEFDQVIIPYASSENYKSNVDKSMLYIACTRAMHKLSITYSKTKTEFI